MEYAGVFPVIDSVCSTEGLRNSAIERGCLIQIREEIWKAPDSINA